MLLRLGEWLIGAGLPTSPSKPKLPILMSFAEVWGRTKTRLPHVGFSISRYY
jgi:hypothetical protein